MHHRHHNSSICNSEVACLLPIFDNHIRQKLFTCSKYSAPCTAAKARAEIYALSRKFLSYLMLMTVL